jgi:hypothetical protein
MVITTPKNGGHDSHARQRIGRRGERGYGLGSSGMMDFHVQFHHLIQVKCASRPR